MVKNIQKYNYSIRYNLSKEHFFKDILKYFFDNELLDNKIFDKIAIQRLELLRVKLVYYTKDESSSVMVEIAEELLNCIDYTIGIYLKSFDDMNLIINEFEKMDLSYMLNMGNDIIKKKLELSKNMLQKIMGNMLVVNNYSYEDTINYGIPLFFKEYDDFFKAHETPGSIDYQLCIDDFEYKGIEYIYNYLYNLSLEVEFCEKFNTNEIKELLIGYDKHSEELLINIFELVLTNSLGLILCGRDLQSININSFDREQIRGRLLNLSIVELQQELLKCSDICCDILDIKNNALIAYIKKAVLKISGLISQSIKLNKLEGVFISFVESNNQEKIEYIDGKKMSNSNFKKLSEAIRDCSLIKDKIYLIKNNVNSIEDLVDILNAECLFDDEYTTYFKSLSSIELIILLKYISTLSDEYEKEWYHKFKKCITDLSQEK